MKILILTNHSFMLYQFRRELIQELLKEHEVHISVPFGEYIHEFEEMGCRMIHTPLDRRGINPVTDFKLFINYWKLLKKLKPDMTITYSIKPNVYGGYACRLLRLPYCVNVQGLGTAFQKKVLAQMVTVMYRVALKKAKIVFFENNSNRDTFLEKKILPIGQTELLPGAGVNLQHYECRSVQKDGCVHFLYVGRLMKEKGVDELFYAARKMKERYGSKVVFDIVGFFEDSYKETVEKLQHDEIIVFHGFRKETRPYYAAADCIVLPSYHEGMSNVLLEAASMGKALITSDIPGCREAVDDGISGYLCRAKDQEDLLDKMVRFAEKTDEERVQMGLLGREKMEKEFDKKIAVQKTVAAIMR